MLNQFTIVFKRWKDSSDNNHYCFQINSHVALKIDETQIKVTRIHVHNIYKVFMTCYWVTNRHGSHTKNYDFKYKINPSRMIAQNSCIYYVQKSPDLYLTEYILIKGFKWSLSCSVPVSLMSGCEVGCQNILTLTAARPRWVTSNEVGGTCS